MAGSDENNPGVIRPANIQGLCSSDPSKDSPQMPLRVPATMTRRCSHCSHNGHNSRTCPNRGVKLFGVRLTDGPIRKSASMGNLSHYAALHATNSASPGDTTPDHAGAAEGYTSEDCVPGSSSSSRERKKGIPWTEEEHRMFLLGLQKLGKGDWRGIARSYVKSRTPTQVASHAQKHFIRQSNVSRRKGRSSLFDIVANEGGDDPMDPEDHIFSPNESHPETQSNNSIPTPPQQEQEGKSMESTNTNTREALPLRPQLSQQPSYPMLYPANFSPFFPFAFPIWMGPTNSHEAPQVLKPTALHSKNPINVDALVGMSNLSLAESVAKDTGGHLSLSLTPPLQGSSRQSAFHARHVSGGSASSPVPAAL